MPSEKAIVRAVARIESKVETILTEGINSHGLWYAMDRVTAIRDVCQKLIDGDDVALLEHDDAEDAEITD